MLIQQHKRINISTKEQNIQLSKIISRIINDDAKSKK